MSSGHKDLSKIKKRLIIEYPYCVACGQYLEESTGTVDHVIPLAVIKWNSEDNIDYEEVTKAFNNPDNLILMCETCNMEKGATILSAETVHSLQLPYEKKSKLISLLQEYDFLIKGYKKIRHDIYNKCNGVCQCGCHRSVLEKYAAIMRVDDNKDRTVSNGVIVHAEHCEKFRIMRRKGKLKCISL